MKFRAVEAKDLIVGNVYYDGIRHNKAKFKITFISNDLDLLRCEPLENCGRYGIVEGLIPFKISILEYPLYEEIAE